MQFAQGKNPTCSICFGIGNLSNFAVVKNVLFSRVLLVKRGLVVFYFSLEDYQERVGRLSFSWGIPVLLGVFFRVEHLQFSDLECLFARKYLS